MRMGRTLPRLAYLALAAAVSPAAAAGLVAYETADVNGLPAIVSPLTGKPGNAKAGEKVVTNRRQGNCLGCHELGPLKATEQFHGELGPALDGAGSRWTEAQLRMIVVNPKRVFTDETVMPAFYRADGLNRVRPEFASKPILTAEQVEDVVAYLGTLK